MARKRYKKKRVDYRKGGRVSLKHGGRPSRKDFNDADQYKNALDNWASDPTHSGELSPQRTSPERMAEISAMEGVPSPTGIKAIDEYNTGLATTRKPRDTRTTIARGQDRKVTGGSNKTYVPPAVTTNKNKGQVPTDRERFEMERGKRIISTGRTAEDIAAGRIPEGTVVKPDVVQIDSDAVGTQAGATQIDSVSPITAETIPMASQEATAQVTDVAQAEAPQAVTAAQMQPAQVTEAVDVTGVTGAVSDDAIAQAAEVADVPLIEGADVVIKEGALAERVVGTLSPQAMATAAQAAGTTLSRVTRAKRQLRNAGISEDAITALGNNPEALEARLMDLTQEERGVIGDLPEEALVSNQLDSLLKGIENGEIPAWASPAVSAVEQMLAQRGLEVSTVGQENLFNAIIQSAVPLAQSNAQAIQQSVAQTRDIESREELANVQMRQQTALQNASNVFQMDMAQFSADQQTALSNSKFLQTASLTEANNDQQAAIQNALILSQSNLAEANMRQQMAIQNAKTFLTMDMANLNNEQQSSLVTAQYQQQVLLSNQSAENAARQFNATSENQTNQFMASLNNQINQYNASAMNQAKIINTQMQNASNARNADRINDVNKANTAMLNQTAQFNAQMDFNRNQWNAANKQAVINSNVNWRRQANTANTAAQNAVNQQNAQNSFSLSQSALSFLWQELRDQADYDFKWANNNADRKMQAMVAAASAEGDAAANWSTNYENAAKVVDSIFGAGGA